MPIKGLTEMRRMPRIGKLHLGIKVTKNKKGEECPPYPKAVDYFVYPEADAPGGELLGQLNKAFGEKPKELRIVFPLEGRGKHSQPVLPLLYPHSRPSLSWRW